MRFQSGSKSEKQNIIGIVSGLSDTKNNAVKNWLQHKSMKSKSTMQLEVISAIQSGNSPVIDLPNLSRYSLLVFVYDSQTEEGLLYNSFIFDLHQKLNANIPFLVVATKSEEDDRNDTEIIEEANKCLNLQELKKDHPLTVVVIDLTSHKRSESEEEICNFLLGHFGGVKKDGCQIC